MSVRGRTANWASFVKVEHTLFSLPVLFAGAILAARGWPGPTLLGWILLAGIGARTLAMALNRLIDRRVDADNPRTANRELPAGRMTVAEGRAIAAAGLLAYAFACWQLPPLCRWLAPVPVAVFVMYPYLKRVTPFAHFGVGLALALAPLGGWVAIRGDLASPEPVLWLAAFTLLWVAGFDVIYATLDAESDRRTGIRSLPSWLGVAGALRISALAHLLAVVALVLLYSRFLAGTMAGIGVIVVVALLLAEQRLAAHVNFAFFQINIAVGFVVLGVVVFGVYGI
jgi:4-hydroxybenzoate polyprenyltransferase